MRNCCDSLRAAFSRPFCTCCGSSSILNATWLFGSRSVVTFTASTYSSDKHILRRSALRGIITYAFGRGPTSSVKKRNACYLAFLASVSFVVGTERLELSHLAVHAPKACAAAITPRPRADCSIANAWAVRNCCHDHRYGGKVHRLPCVAAGLTWTYTDQTKGKQRLTRAPAALNGR